MARKTEFSLDTKSFSQTASYAKSLAENLENAIADADKAINALYSTWVGKGRNEFEKKYKIFEQQVADVKNGLWDVYEEIVSAEEAYIEADCIAAKGEDGTTARYTDLV